MAASRCRRTSDTDRITSSAITTAPRPQHELALSANGRKAPEAVTSGVRQAKTDNTRRAYDQAWGGITPGPRPGHDRAADEWAAHINTNRGAGEVTYSFREPLNHSGYYEMYGTVNFEGNGSLSVNVRGRFGETWGTWSPTGSLYCYTTEKPSRN